MKASFLAIPCLFLAMASAAQDKVLSIGIEGGSALSTQYGFERNKDYTYGKPVNVTGGLSLMINLSRHLSIKTGLNYERKGQAINAQFYYNNGIMTVKEIHDFDYATIPLVLRAGWGKKKVRRFIALGGYGSYLLDKTKTTLNYSDIRWNAFVHDKNFVKEYDYGLIAGIGFTYSINEHVLLSCELRDNLGLENISRFPMINGGELKNHSGSFLIGIFYNFLRSPRKHYNLEGPKTKE
jgi:hypothetical protein